jgi:hypothetical protein
MQYKIDISIVSVSTMGVLSEGSAKSLIRKAIPYSVRRGRISSDIPSPLAKRMFNQCRLDNLNGTFTKGNRQTPGEN